MSFDEELIKKEWVKRVKELMPQCGFQTYQDLAYKSGVSAGSLNQAMRGMHLPRQTTIDKIATALGTTSQFLLYGDTMKVSHKVPVLRGVSQMYWWFSDTDEKLKINRFVEPSGNLDLSNKAFAWVVKQNNMQPLFNPGDIVIFESGIDLFCWPDVGENYVLVAYIVTANKQYDEGNRNFENIYKFDASGLLFGKTELTNSGVYVVSENSNYPPILLKPQHMIIGIAIQQIRNFTIINSTETD